MCTITMITCVACTHLFKTKQQYERHLKSRKHLLRLGEDMKLLICPFCEKQFSHASTLSTHKKKCTVILKQESIVNQLKTERDNMKQQLEDFEKERNEMRSQIAMLMEKCVLEKSNRLQQIDTQNNTTNNHINNGTHVNIIVKSFGHENIDHLTDKILCRLIQTAPFTCVPQLIEKIHFDPDHPENHNIKITNKKMNYAEIIKNNKWITTNKQKVIDEIIQNSYNILDEKYTGYKDSMSEKRQERFDKFQEKYENNDYELHCNIKKDVDLIIINGTNEIHK